MTDKIICCVIASILFISCGNDKSQSTGTVNINDVRPASEPTADLTNHKYHDVEVYRAKHRAQTDSIHTITLDAYSIFFYRNDSGKLRCYKFSDDVAEDFDKADYEWQNDTLLSIRLHNSSSKKEIAFKLFGKGNTTGVDYN